MVRSLFSGVAGLRAHQTKMDVIGNNIANVNTYGFKSGRVTFKDAFYQTLTAASDASDGMGGSNASQIGYGSTVGSIDVMHTQGAFAPTDNPSDLMIQGNGYFMVGALNTGAGGSDQGYSATNGSVNQLNLTRIGAFNFDAQGYLVDSNKNIVYGFRPDSVTDGGFTGTGQVYAIKIPSMAAGTADQRYDPTKEGMLLSDITFSSDGTITGIAADGSLVYVGRVAMANVPNPNGLEMTENSYFKAKQNTGTVQAFTPGTGTTGKVHAGGLEMSNVDLSKEFTEMIVTQRGYQANTRIITVTDEMLQELVNIKR